MREDLSIEKGKSDNEKKLISTENCWQKGEWTLKITSGWENAIPSFYLLPFILRQKEISKIVGAFVLLGKDIQKILGTMPYYTQILGR